MHQKKDECVFADSNDELPATQFKFLEKLGQSGQTRVYSSTGTQCMNIKVETTQVTLLNSLQHLFMQVFLPAGYPDSVSADYTNYQIWDTVQAFCSTIMGTFTTQSILKTVGVGNEAATPLAAAITWVLKDGSGMIGRILFAWLQGEYLDSNCKPWRLFADVLNDTALTLEFILPYTNFRSMYWLCITSTMKSIVGVAGGATRAAITQHQAVKGNMGDVSAKDGSQETCVNLVASIVGIFLLTTFQNHELILGLLFVVLIVGHVYANYLAVKSLTFKHLNLQRFLILLKSYMQFDAVANPFIVNKMEPLVLGCKLSSYHLCGYDIKIGQSLRPALQSIELHDLQILREIFKGKNYIIVPHFAQSTLYVGISDNCDATTVIKAYFHASMFGMILCQYNNLNLNIKAKRQLHHVTPIQRVGNLMKRFPRNQNSELCLPPLVNLKMFNDFVASEQLSFFTALSINGWELSRHSLNTGEWLCELDASNVTSKKDD